MIRPIPVYPTKKRRRLIAAWFGVVALALPLLAPLAQAIPLSGSTDSLQSPIYMVLCKAMQRGTSQPEVPPEQNPNFSDCPVCLGFAFGKSVLFSPLATNPVPQGLPLVFTFNTNDEADNGRGTSRTHARAPPLSA